MLQNFKAGQCQGEHVPEAIYVPGFGLVLQSTCPIPLLNVARFWSMSLVATHPIQSTGVRRDLLA
jgi:hypothetical protein